MTKIAVENVNLPGQVTNVDAAMMAVMSDTALTWAQIKDACIPHLPDDLYPKGATSGWWIKTVQLDLEAKGKLARQPSKPLSWSVT
jgi:hypothetical protein